MEYYSSTFLISFNKTSMHWKIIAESTSFQLSYNHNILQMGVLRGHSSQLHPLSSQRYNLLLKSDIIDRNHHSQFHVLVWLLLSKQLKFNQNILKTRPPKLEQTINRMSKACVLTAAKTPLHGYSQYLLYRCNRHSSDPTASLRYEIWNLLAVAHWIFSLTLIAAYR